MTAPAHLPALGVGMVLHPDQAYLSLCADLIERDADFYEVSPETLWRTDESGGLHDSPWADVFLDLKAYSGKPFVGHGLGLSPGTAPGSDAEARRLRQWVDQVARHQRRFGYLWYTEHLGWVTAEGLAAVLPMPLPPTDESVAVVTSRLSLLKPVVPTVGFENQVSYFTFGDPRDEAPFWTRLCHAGDLWLLLDLHNAWTQCLNTGLDLDEYLSGLDLSRVLEIHLSGGSDSEPGWLPGGGTLRLDTHDAPVPEPVWRAFERVRPRCPNLRGVVVERMNGSFHDAGDVGDYAAELRRAKRIFAEGRPC